MNIGEYNCLMWKSKVKFCEFFLFYYLSLAIDHTIFAYSLFLRGVVGYLASRAFNKRV